MPYIYLSEWLSFQFERVPQNIHTIIFMSWFEDWFDSPLYEKLYANRNEDEASLLADLIEKEIPPETYTEILDLGCGRGRHSITLAERGYHVTGIDLSEEAIAKATRIASGKNLENVEFITGDMRDPIAKKFDAILNLFTTFGYFLDDAENAKVLKNISGLLKPQGVAIIDFFNASLIQKNLVPEDSGSFKNLDYRIERKIEEDMVFKRIHFSGPSLKGDVEYLERVKLYDLNWFVKELTNAGLKLNHIYGNYTGVPFQKENSPRLIMVCSKIDS